MSIWPWAISIAIWLTVARPWEQRCRIQDKEDRWVRTSMIVFKTDFELSLQKEDCMIQSSPLLRLRKKLNLDLSNLEGGHPIYPFWPCLLSEELNPPLLQPLILTEEHCLLRVFTAVVFGKPAQRAAILATVAPPPGGRTFPTAMSSTSFGSILDWAMIPLKTEKNQE